MKRVHPQLNLAAALIALAYLSGAVGCKNQQTAVAANPFLGPNRVPPPATRTLAPGQAQPYYQGDSLPVSQQGAGQLGATAAAATPTQPEMPSADGNLAWSSPGAATTASNSRSASPPVTTAPPNSSVVASNEPTVAVPNDGNALRFAPPTQPQEFTPNNAVALASQPMSNVAQPQASPQLTTPSSVVVPATYVEPVVANSGSAATSPWRSPQIPPSSEFPASAVPANHAQQIAAQPVGQSIAGNTSSVLTPYYATPSAVAANTMEVRLREVPSPPMPRIRIPGEPSVPTIGNADGFRPRSSMR